MRLCTFCGIYVHRYPLIVGTISKPTNFTVNFYNNDYAIKGRWKAKKDLFKQFIIYGFVNAAE